MMMVNTLAEQAIQEDDIDGYSVSGHDDADETTCHDSEKAAVAEIEEKIAKSETHTLTWMRIGLAAVLLAATVLVSVLIYLYVKGAETEEFQLAFDDNSAKILEAFAEEAELRFGAVAGFAASLTAYTVATNATWPFVRVPQLEAQAESTLSLAGVDSLTFAMILEPEDRPKWENEYVPNNGRAWVEESAARSGLNISAGAGAGGPPPGRPGAAPAADQEYEGKPTRDSNGYYEQITTRSITPLGERGDMVADDVTNLVWWQTTPMVPETPSTVARFMNYDVQNDPNYDGRLLGVLQEKKAIIGAMSARAYGASEDSPISSFYYPVMTGYITEDGNEPHTAGAFATLLPWNTFFENILPQNANGLIAVLKTSCGQAFTYQINGPEAVLLGQGDLHDPNFNKMMAEVSLDTLINEAVEDGSFKGFPLDDGGCQYSLQVYASADMEAVYISNDPIYYTIGAVLIFLFTSGIFILYDRIVERRQRLVMREAEKSGAIVSSLFPAEYKKKLMEEEEAKQNMEANKNKAPSFMSGKGGAEFQHSSMTAVPQAQIAQLYPDCTIFFADIAGFTKWSSTRTPADVFTLLQTLFGQFDQVANRRGVFKIETIGDCYLAVTGCPNAQRNHALIMTKFANECLLKMDGACRDLADTLGEDTRALALRVGLHSGSITAGVLRGEKSRFQVFGDTVNTGSRMESTGERNRIQVSEATATILREKHGKGSWLQARDEMIEAKGKGKMQTYWVSPERSLSGSVMSMSLSLTDSSTAGGPAPESGLRDTTHGPPRNLGGVRETTVDDFAEDEAEEADFEDEDAAQDNQTEYAQIVEC